MPKNSLTRRIRRAYCQDELARICTLPEHKFGSAFGMQTVTVDQKWPSYSDRSEDYYHFRDNGGRVLAVAHLDTVVRGNRRTPRFRATENGPLITSGALDDRLGAYVILRMLPKLSITCDWLLTVGEESGQSTAEFFKPEKDYDWLIEFDRAGTDVVMYQYEDRASREAVQASGAVVGNGSYSDIAYLEHLGVKAFNWGVGYRGDYHSERGYAYLNDTFAMIAKYLRFSEQNAGVAMLHDSDRPWWDDDEEYDYYTDCEVCGARESVDSVTLYCAQCGSCADCGLAEDAGCMCYTPRHIREVAAGYARSGDEPPEPWSSFPAARTTSTLWTAMQVTEPATPATDSTAGPWLASTEPATDGRPSWPGDISWAEYLSRRYGNATHSLLSDELVREVARRRTSDPAWHQEQDCQGCTRCKAAREGVVHVIPAHHEDSPHPACIQCQERAIARTAALVAAIARDGE